MNRENRSSWSQITRQQARPGGASTQQPIFCSQDVISGGAIINIVPKGQTSSMDKRGGAASRRREMERDKDHWGSPNSPSPLQHSAKQLLSGYPTKNGVGTPTVGSIHSSMPSIGASSLPALPSLAITFDDTTTTKPTSHACPGLPSVPVRSRNRVSRRAVEYLSEAQERAEKYRKYAAAAPTPILPVSTQVLLPTSHPLPATQLRMEQRGPATNHVVGSIAVLGAGGIGSSGARNSKFPTDENSRADINGVVGMGMGMGMGGGMWLGNGQDGVVCMGESYVDVALSKPALLPAHARTHVLPRTTGVVIGGASSAVADLDEDRGDVRGNPADVGGVGRGLAAIQFAEERSGQAFKSKWHPNVDTSALAPDALHDLNRNRRSAETSTGYLGSKIEEHHIVKNAKEDAREEARELIAQIRREAEKEARVSARREHK